jgi:hypothetical protein
MNAAPQVGPAILELARILAREAVRRYIEEQTQKAAPSAEESRAE